MKESKRHKISKCMIIILAIVIITVVFFIGIGIYNVPVNRLHRQLELGNKYLKEENYEEACLAFEQAIEIDERCIEAYVGGMEAYRHMNDTEGLQALYDKAFAVLRSLDADEMEKSLDDVVAICLLTGSAYRDDLEYALELLEEAYYLTGENEEIMQGLGVLLENYIMILIQNNQYDEVYSLIEQYGDIVTNIDFQAIIKQMEEAAEKERVEEKNSAFMQKVYELMAAEDYEGMCELSVSAEAAEFYAEMPEAEFMQPGCLYFPDGTMTYPAIGVAAYHSGNDVPGVFYYGELLSVENDGGTPMGEGTLFALGECYGGNNGLYQVFTGTWNNQPQGQGKIKTVHSTGEYTRYSVIEGNFVNGLCDGAVHCQLFGGTDTIDLSFTASYGLPTEDKTEEYLTMIRYRWDSEYIDMIRDMLQANIAYIYAYEVNTQSAQNAFAYYSGSERIGVPGFGFSMRIN